MTCTRLRSSIGETLFLGRVLMSFSLLVDLCGTPLLVVLTILSLALSVMAFCLTFGLKQQMLLIAFMPLAVLPIAAGLATTFFSVVSSIGQQLETDTAVALDSGFLIQMHMVPVLAGMLAAMPPLVIASVGRWMLAWRASGLRLFPTRKQTPETEELNPGDFVKQEAEDYLDKLVRPR